MKALSLIQPWASLAILGAKRFETRSWQTSYRGPLVICASKKVEKAAQGMCWQEPFRSALGIVEDGKVSAAWPLLRGAALGVVELIGCYPIEQVGRERQALKARHGQRSWRRTVLS